MLYFILPLLLCSKAFHNCAAANTSDISYDTSKSNPIVSHLIKASPLDSTVDVVHVITKHSDNAQNPGIDDELPKDLEMTSEVKKAIVRHSIRDMLKNIQVENSTEDSDFDRSISNLSQVVYSKLTNILRNRMKELFSKTFPLNREKSGSDNSEDTHASSESTEAHSSDVSDVSEELDKETKALVNNSDERVPSGRQFVFHPYLPYSKDALPDEKISIHDVIPVKMVKFIKSMVEDAPWEQMFMKMVRMVVDQFVDKIIEKMFAHKDEDDKWRSLEDDPKTAAWSLPQTVLTSVVRMRRSSGGKLKSEKEEAWSDSNFSSANRVSKEDRSKVKESPEEESWLDSILDYMFPEDSKADSFGDDDSETEQREKRDTTETTPSESRSRSEIIHGFLIRLINFQSEKLTPETVDAVVKESIRRKTLQIMSPSDIEDNDYDDDESILDASSLPMDNPSELLSERWLSVLKSEGHPSIVDSTENATRVKRSATDDTDEENIEKRLWQANRRTRPSNSKARDDCSLRRACNAGRLLSRLPSVQDITLQLKAYGNEPHWDALLWGMSKKRCSRIFCKRQRSPKGSKHRWDIPEKPHHKKSTSTSRGSRLRFDESDLTTIYPV
ncbi:uncharacterized protein NPIL_150141 [Nephila pilipes]|uniref:Uncharacterized protein n=1 Tax=Nephila pilipes TaxID=299642 RepID=A0A8X6PQZ2_NEPPI|nr:uncharacterized protein NPIL_150141 [Nephila pilipes]